MSLGKISIVDLEVHYHVGGAGGENGCWRSELLLTIEMTVGFRGGGEER